MKPGTLVRTLDPIFAQYGTVIEPEGIALTSPLDFVTVRWDAGGVSDELVDDLEIVE